MPFLRGTTWDTKFSSFVGSYTKAYFMNKEHARVRFGRKKKTGSNAEEKNQGSAENSMADNNAEDSEDGSKK